MKDIRLWTLVSLIIVIVGGINWGLFGLANINLIGAILGGGTSILARLAYIIVGIAAGFLIYVNWIKKE